MSRGRPYHSAVTTPPPDSPDTTSAHAEHRRWRAADRAGQDRPEPGTVEVNLFGPGYGESIAIHLGDNRWMIVDSCARGDAEPAALLYLRRLGCDLRDVKYLVATHWHDDHIRGFSTLIEQCPDADVFLSQALNVKPLLVRVMARTSRDLPSLSEMNRTIHTLIRRAARRTNRQPFHYLSEDKPVHSNVHHPGNDVEIWALSPSSQDFDLAIAALVRTMPRLSEGASLDAVPRPRENHASIVLHVRAGNQRILLGADREVLGSGRRGWNSVAACATRRGLGRSSLFKIAHHGSPNGDAPVIWEDLLEPEPVVVLTPFRRGYEGGRPRRDDVDRILARTPWAFTTCAPGDYSLLAEGISDMLSDADHEVEDAQLPLGHIRARALTSGSPWSVELFRPAAHLGEKHCTHCATKAG